MEEYLEEVRKIEKQFLGVELQHVPHGTNKEADDIAKRVSRREPRSMASSRNDSSSHPPPLQARCCFGRNRPRPAPRAPWHVA